MKLRYCGNEWATFYPPEGIEDNTVQSWPEHDGQEPAEVEVDADHWLIGHPDWVEAPHG